MPGPPPLPDDQRVRRAPPARPWRNAPGHGWQHGRVPNPPTGVTPATRKAWRTWFAAWWAAFWTPEDLPGLRVVALLYDAVEEGELRYHAELRIAMDRYGMSEKGRQALRWQPALEPEAKAWTTHDRGQASARERLRDRLRVTATDHEWPAPRDNGVA